MGPKRLVPISALQHYRYCPRQCALIHVEQTFDENLYTLRGHRAHERVDEPGSRIEGEGRVQYALPIWSDKLAIVGRADVVEFPSSGPLHPVEHKVGRRKARRADEVQLCAQALCLEEMFGVEIPCGALYYNASQRRRTVEFNEALRILTHDTIADVRDLLERLHVPPPVDDERCPPCSLIDSCLPSVIAKEGAR
ncbi:MAG: CRISPR-associated protein Cas4 [Candidatus Thermoplasmatota archaeon]|nr:CRISPR-associated protein Cas4 [Candidatus Thermoplasmatota archaeon]